MNACRLWIRRGLAVAHVAGGLILVLSVVFYVVVVLRGLPQLAIDAPRTRLPGALLLVATVILLPQVTLGAWLLVLGRWLWSGHRWLRPALLVTHGFVLLLGALFIRWGFDALAAAERSTAHGGGLLSPAAFFPFLIGVPCLAFALGSLAVALWVIQRPQPGSR